MMCGWKNETYLRVGFASHIKKMESRRKGIMLGTSIDIV